MLRTFSSPKFAELIAFSLLSTFTGWGTQASLDSHLLRLENAKKANFSFEDLDFSPLRKQAFDRDLGLSEDELERVIRLNFRFIFLNKLNINRFLIIPTPQKVVDRMVSVLQLNEQLKSLVQKGRQLAVSQRRQDVRIQLIRQIGQLAKELQDVFSEYFLEINRSTYQIGFPRLTHTQTRFVYYVVQSDRISRLITQAVDNYFFNPTPEAIELSEYDRISIKVLSEALHELSQIVVKRSWR